MVNDGAGGGSPRGLDGSNDGIECLKGKESNPITITASMAQGASGQVSKLGVAWQGGRSRNDPDAKRQGGGGFR